MSAAPIQNSTCVEMPPQQGSEHISGGAPAVVDALPWLGWEVWSR